MKNKASYNAKFDFYLDMIKTNVEQYNMNISTEWLQLLSYNKKSLNEKLNGLEGRLNLIFNADTDINQYCLLDNCLDLLFEQYISFMKNDAVFMRLLMHYNVSFIFFKS